jgi:hypothetical protein
MGQKPPVRPRIGVDVAQRVGYWGEFLDSFDAAREALERYESHEKLIRPVTDPKKKGRYSIHDGRDKEITLAESAEGGCG